MNREEYLASAERLAEGMRKHGLLDVLTTEQARDFLQRMMDFLLRYKPR